MFRDKMKVFTTVMLALSFLMGALSLSVPGVAYASSQAANPPASVPSANARWVTCNVDGDFDADDYCWVGGANYFLGNGGYFLGNGGYFRGNGMYVFRNGRWVLRNRFLLPSGLVLRNGYIMRNGRIIGYMNNLGYPIYYSMP
jgi:hypothetical protein